MSIVNIQALKQQGCQLWWPGQSAESGAYDDDGNKRGFMILPDGVTVTPSGTFTTQKMKDGRNVWKFDGSTNYISLSDHDAWYFGSGDFAICCWIKAETLSSNHQICGQVPSNGGVAGTSFALIISEGTPRFYWIDNGITSLGYSSTTGALSLSTWTHIAIVGYANYITFYVNAINGGSFAYTNIINSSLLFYIGASQYTSWVKLNGNIKDLMIFKGKALTQDQIAAIMEETYIY